MAYLKGIIGLLVGKSKNMSVNDAGVLNRLWGKMRKKVTSIFHFSIRCNNLENELYYFI